MSRTGQLFYEVQEVCDACSIVKRGCEGCIIAVKYGSNIVKIVGKTKQIIGIQPEVVKKIRQVAVAVMLLIAVLCGSVSAESINRRLAIRAIVGEASNQGYHGMLALACGIRNRGTLQGVYGVNAKHADREPKWVWREAEKAWDESEYNRIHNGDHWENIKAFGTPNWARNKKVVYHYLDHVFYK